jgi:hypothetical protein
MIDRRGWEVLGYKSVEQWAAESFGQTPGRISQLLTAARIEEHIRTRPFTTVNGQVPSHISERSLRPLAVLLHEHEGLGWKERDTAAEDIASVWDIALKMAGDEMPTSRHTTKAVEMFLNGETWEEPDPEPEPDAEEEAEAEAETEAAHATAPPTPPPPDPLATRDHKSHQAWDNMLMRMNDVFHNIQQSGGVRRVARDWTRDERRAYRQRVIDAQERLGQIRREIEEAK